MCENRSVVSSVDEINPNARSSFQRTIFPCMRRHFYNVQLNAPEGAPRFGPSDMICYELFLLFTIFTIRLIARQPT